MGSMANYNDYVKARLEYLKYYIDKKRDDNSMAIFTNVINNQITNI